MSGNDSGASTVPVNEDAKARSEETASWFSDPSANELDATSAEDELMEAAFGEGETKTPEDTEMDDPQDDPDEEDEEEVAEEPEPDEAEDTDDFDEVEDEPEVRATPRAEKRIRKLSAKLKEKDDIIAALKATMEKSLAVQERHARIYEEQHEAALAQRREFEARREEMRLKEQFAEMGLDVDRNPAARQFFEQQRKLQQMEEQMRQQQQTQSEAQYQRQYELYTQALDAEFNAKLADYDIQPKVREWLRNTAIQQAQMHQLPPDMAVQAAFSQAQEIGVSPKPRTKAPKKKPSKTEARRERMSARDSAPVGRKKGQTRGGRKSGAQRAAKNASLEDQIFPEFGAPGHWG